MWRIFKIVRKKMINFIIIFMDFCVGIFSLCYDDEKLAKKIVNLFHCVTIMILNVLHELDISCGCCKKKKAQEEENEYNESDKNEFKKRLKLMEKDAIILKKAKMEKNPELVEMSRKMKLAYKEWKTLLEEQDK